MTDRIFLRSSGSKCKENTRVQVASVENSTLTFLYIPTLGGLKRVIYANPVEDGNMKS